MFHIERAERVIFKLVEDPSLPYQSPALSEKHLRKQVMIESISANLNRDYFFIAAFFCNQILSKETSAGLIPVIRDA